VSAHPDLGDLAMQFLSPVRRAASAWREDPSGGSRLPYAAQIDDHTLLLRDGRLMQTLHVQGLLFETADTDELNYRKALRDGAMRALASSEFALYQHVVRRRVDPVREDAFPDDFSAALDAAWSERLRRKALFRNDIYLSIIRRPRAGGVGFADRLAQFAFGAASSPVERLGAERRALDAARAALSAALAAYGVRLLGAYDRRGRLQSEPLEFLSEIYNGLSQPRGLPEGDFGEAVPARRVSFGLNTVELSAFGAQDRAFVGVLSMKEYPGHSSPGMLDDLLRLPIEFVLTQSFAFVDRQAALGRVNLALRRMRAADDDAVSLRDELVEARDDVAAGRAAFGEHHLTIAIRAEDPDRLNGAVAEVQAAMADLGIVAVREDLGLEPAFWAQFPGNSQFITRRALISTRTFAGFASGHNFPLGQPDGVAWGRAVAVLETTAAGPYFFNFHQGDLGNFTIIGPSGSGKTVVLNFLLAQSRRFDPTIVFFDKDRGAELFIRAIGGRYDVLRPGQPSGLNPMALPDTPTNRRFLLDWLTTLLSANGALLGPQEIARIEDAVDANFAAPAHLRRLGAFADLLRGGQRPTPDDLYARLKPWWGAGERAWLFDNPRDLTDSSAKVVGFDMTRLLDDPVTRTPTMMYLFHRVEERLDGTPSIIVVDEGWKALDDAVFVERLKDWEKTIRKRNGLVGFVTQSAEDALKSRIASAVVEQAATQIFMANPKAQARDYVEGFGLTAYEFELVRTLPDTEHCFLIKHGRDSVVARLNLAGEDDLLTILSGRERTVRLLDDIRRETGDDPAAWIPELLRQGAT
jgi:type IV secretion system protein VirB4